MRRAAAVAAPLLLILAAAVWRSQGPPPRDLRTPENDFSSARAMAVLRILLQEEDPHPVGTPANARVRDRVIERFRALGYETTIQQRFTCNASAVCAVVHNVIARRPGAPRRDALLLAAHHDSVPAGPGASDDGVGVATLLEVARAIRNETFRNPVVFLVDDGEEAGLLGAEAFVSDPALAREFSAVINVENRGTYGVSNMFETSPGNRWLIRHLARSLERPHATSLYYAIYSLMPNDTDVTVFKRAGKAAVNFAAIRGVNWYHTPYDDLAHVSPRTLQHHGENVLALTRTLADADLGARSRTDATYFDVLGFFLIWWPQEWTIWIAIGSLVALLAGIRRTDPRAMTFGVLGTFASILLALLIGVALAWIARLRAADITWVAYPLPAVAAMWFAGLAGPVFGMAIFNRRDDARGLLYGAAIVWHAIGIIVAITLPGAAYVFVVPAVALTICALAKASVAVTSAIGASAAGILLFPFAILLHDALGGRRLAVIALIVAIFATLVAPLFARARFGALAGVIAIALSIIALAAPQHSAERPRLLSLSYLHDAGAPSPLWIAPSVPAELREVAPFAEADRVLMPWSRNQMWSAPAPRLDLPPVEMTAERNGDHVRIRVRSRRAANRLVLTVKGGMIRSVNDVMPPPRTGRRRVVLPDGWQSASAMAVQEMIVDVIANAPVVAVASDITFGLPDAGAQLAAARAAVPAIPIQDGDTTVTRVRATW